MAENIDLSVMLGRVEGKIDALSSMILRHDTELLAMQGKYDNLVPLLTIAKVHADEILHLQKDNEENKKWRWRATGIATALAAIGSFLMQFFFGSSPS